MATARRGTGPSSAKEPVPWKAWRASAEGSSPTWSCPLLSSLTTSRGVWTAAATAFEPGTPAAIASATACASAAEPGRDSALTTTRCLARYAYHCLYGEWPSSSSPAAASSAVRAILSIIVVFVLVEHVELQEVGDDVVGDVDEVADFQIAGHAAQDVGLRRTELLRRRRLRPGQQVDHLEQRVARGERHVLGLIGERREVLPVRTVEPFLRQ